MPHDVFISYSARDKKAADAACAVLEAHGIRCWIAPRDVLPGANWAEAILNAMQQARVMVLIFSAHANQSEQIKHEVERAVSRGLPIIPVRLEDVLPAKSLEYFISASHWLDAFPPPMEDHFRQLAESVRGFLPDKPSVSPELRPPPPSAPWIRRYWRWAAAMATVLVLLVGAAVFFREESGLPQFIIEAVKVPIKFSDTTGMDGSVLAAHLLDRLNDLEKESDVYSFRATDHFIGEWPGAENEEVGWQGNPFRHDTRVDGDVVNENGGWELRVRVIGHEAHTFSIIKGDVETAINNAADWVFQEIAPYRYAIVIGQRNHTDSETLFLDYARRPQNPEHLWADSKLSEHYFSRGDYEHACKTAQEAYTEAPRFIPTMLDLANCRFAMGDLNTTRNLLETSIERLSSTLPPDISPAAVADLLPQLQSRIAEFSDAWSDAITLRNPVRYSQVNYLIYKMPPWDATDYAEAHDVRSALAKMKDAHMAVAGRSAGQEDGRAIEQFQSIGFEPSNFFVAVALDDWATAASDLSEADKTALAFGNVNEIRHRYVWPWLAYAEVRSGNLKVGEILIAMTPHDCYVCLEMRGRIAALKGDTSGAQDWFQRAVASAKALPFAYADWGAMLLTRGNFDGAIEKFRQANKYGPHFADPLEMWGEALMLKNHSDLALAKFEEANKFAPSWGHLHLKWGEALGYVGRREDAQTQYQTAATLSLSTSDQNTLRARTH
jgi:tetratricopeptide (TPR) repeat protein